jgi:NitT/TauT family transport system substrate-binding protein
VSTAQLIANRSDMFGYSDGYVVGASVAKGMNIRMVANITRRTPTAAIVLAESNIKSPKELEGKTVGIPPGSGPYHQWPAYVKGCGLDGSKIKVVGLDPAGAPTALIQGAVDGIVGFVNGYVPLIEGRSKKKANFFPYADCGVSNVSLGIIVHNDLIKENPDLIRRFVAASSKGFIYVSRNPVEAGQIVKKYLDPVVPAVATRELELSLDFWVTPNTRGKPMGWMSDKDWEDTVRILREYGGVTTPLDPKQLYTNEFVPTGPEYNYP